MKNTNPTIHSPIVVAAAMLEEYYLLIGNMEMAKKSCLMAIDFIIQSWSEDEGAYFWATRKCWESVKEIVLLY